MHKPLIIKILPAKKCAKLGVFLICFWVLYDIIRMKAITFAQTGPLSSQEKAGVR